MQKLGWKTSLVLKKTLIEKNKHNHIKQKMKYDHNVYCSKIHYPHWSYMVFNTKMNSHILTGDSILVKGLSSGPTIMTCQLKMSLAVTEAINKQLEISIQMLGLSEYNKQGMEETNR